MDWWERVRQRRRYEADERLDWFLVSTIAKHVKRSLVWILEPHGSSPSIETVAPRLANNPQLLRTERALYCWYKECTRTVKQFMQVIALWITNNNVDFKIWSSLIPYVDPDLLPDFWRRLDTCDTALTKLSLGRNGSLLENFIRRQGYNPPLQLLNVRDYFMPHGKWIDLLLFISTCKNLTQITLVTVSLSQTGPYLAQAIISLGKDLQVLELFNCSLLEDDCVQVFRSLSGCRNITYLALPHNSLSKSGHILARSIRSWGKNSPLQLLGLENCSMPEQVWWDVLKSLSGCKNLRKLYLSGNTLGMAGYQLAQSIRCWGNEPLLQVLGIWKCSLPTEVCFELLQSLSKCKFLSQIYLSGNNMDTSGHYLAVLIKSWNDDPPLEVLGLEDCSIPQENWTAILQSLAICKKLTTLFLSNNHIGKTGHHLSQSIVFWGDNPQLQKLHLQNCEMPQQVCAKLMQSLGNCKRLTDLYLSGNCLTGCLSSFLKQPNATLSLLENLDIKCTNMNKEDVKCLTNVIQTGKLSNLRNLYLEDSWSEMTEELFELYNTRFTRRTLTLHLKELDAPFLKENEENIQQNAEENSSQFTQEELDTAYHLACKEDTKEVFNARMNLVGHREAGKTSLATRLMGKKFKEDVQSTEGISTHLIKSRFKTSDRMGVKWSETKMDYSDFLKEFSHAVLARSMNISTRVTDTGHSHLIPTEEISELHSTNCDTESVPIGVGTKQVLEQTEAILLSDNVKNNCYETDHFRVIDDTAEGNMKVARSIGFATSTFLHEERVDLKVGGSKISTLSDQLKNEILAHKDTLPEKEHEEISMSIRLWDLGGQNEFIATHHLFLGADSTTLIVMDITKPLHQKLDKNPKLGHPNTPAEVLHYWLNSLYVQMSLKHIHPNVALVLTHKDVLQGKDIEKYVDTYVSDILKTMNLKLYAKFITKDNIYIVDNKSGNDTEFENLKNKLFLNLAQQDNWGRQIPMRWTKLKADMLKKTMVEGKRYLSLMEVTSLGKQFGMNNKEIQSFLRIQNTLGDFIYYSQPQLRQIVITDPQWLIDMLSALITHHQFLETHNLNPLTLHDLISGQITENGLEDVWKRSEVNFLKQLMIAFNLIFPIDSSGQRYIIPCMLPQRDINMHQKGPFECMEIVYAEDQNPKLGDSFLIGTFHQLLSDCSKTPNWKLCADSSSGLNHPSYTDASFQIKDGTRLALTLMSSSKLRTAIWCSKEALWENTDDLIAMCKETRKELSTKMKRLGVSQDATFHIICPYNKPCSTIVCLSKMKEYVNLSGNSVGYWYQQKYCSLHGKLLQSVVHPLLIMSLDAIASKSKESARAQIQKQMETFPLRIHRQNKDYLATMTSGMLSTIQDSESKVSIEVAEGVKAIVMQHVYSNLELLNSSMFNGECIVSPVVKLWAKQIAKPEAEGIGTFEQHQKQENDDKSKSDYNCKKKDIEELSDQFYHEDSNDKSEKSYHLYKLTIPHYVDRTDLLDSIKVKWGNISGSLTEIHKGKTEDNSEPHCEVYDDHVTVYANHFCDVVCTCSAKVCASKILAIPFGQIDSDSSRKDTYAKVKTYLCNHLYQDVSLKKKLKEEASEFGLVPLEQIVIPLDPTGDFKESEATVELKVTKSWGPSFQDDEKWNVSKRKMTENTQLSDMMHIVDGHLCKSTHFDAANFGLKAKGVVDSFHGNIGVKISNAPAKSRQTDIRIPPPFTKEDKKEEVMAVEIKKQPDSNQLTDGMILKLAKRISKPLDLLCLGTLGLDMKEEVLEQHLQDKKDDINMAAYEVLKTWKASQPNRTVAYENLCKALRHEDVDKGFLVIETLQPKHQK